MLMKQTASFCRNNNRQQANQKERGERQQQCKGLTGWCVRWLSGGNNKAKAEDLRSLAGGRGICLAGLEEGRIREARQRPMGWPNLAGLMKPGGRRRRPTTYMHVEQISHAGLAGTKDTKVFSNRHHPPPPLSDIDKRGQTYLHMFCSL